MLVLIIDTTMEELKIYQIKYNFFLSRETCKVNRDRELWMQWTYRIATEHTEKDKWHKNLLIKHLNKNIFYGASTVKIHTRNYISMEYNIKIKKEIVELFKLVLNYKAFLKWNRSYNL